MPVALRFTLFSTSYKGLLAIWKVYLLSFYPFIYIQLLIINHTILIIMKNIISLIALILFIFLMTIVLYIYFINKIINIFGR